MKYIKFWWDYPIKRSGRAKVEHVIQRVLCTRTVLQIYKLFCISIWNFEQCKLHSQNVRTIFTVIWRDFGCNYLQFFNKFCHDRHDFLIKEVCHFLHWCCKYSFVQFAYKWLAIEISLMAAKISYCNYLHWT
jgi:hypothetical protein